MRSCTRRPIARILLAALLAAPAARAEIAGEQVVSGTATFDQTGNVTTIHASDGAIIDYSQFDIWANEELHFVQPSSESRVLNRVLGDATHIDGGLYANGIVYIVNPAGIFFGPFAVVDVGGLYAAAGDISNEDFLARIDRFTLSGVALNAGSIESPAVALVGTAVENHANIHAPNGTIALVAGEKVLLTQLGAHIAVQVEGAGGSAQAPAIEQTGSVDAGAGAVSFVTGDVYSLAINHTGITRGREIELRAESGTVQVAGTLDASDRSAGGTGGSIAVAGERVALFGARLDASGDAGGGEIRVGGDLHGEGALPTARRSYVDEASSLRADAISEGVGGRVIVWADEATAFHGAVSARGGARGGDGGFAEISGAAFLEADGHVDLGAASGATGTLLYDPKDIVLHAGALDGSDAPDASDVALSGASLGRVLFGTPDELATPFDVYESELEGTNANIELQATNSISSTDAFDVGILDGNSLTMQTRNNTDDQLGTALTPGIHLANVSFQASGGIAIATGTDGAGGGGTGSAAGIEVGNLTTAGTDGETGAAGGAVTLAARGTGSVTAGAIDTSGGSGGATGAGGTGGAISVTTVNGAIDVASANASGGDGTTSVAGAGGGAGGAIALRAGDSDSNADSDVTVTGDLISRGGAATTAGAGGAGGGVTVRSDGVLTALFPTQSTQQVIAGGGDLSLQKVDTRGGTSTQSMGGPGGSARIETTDGAIHAGVITTSGGDGDTTGGNAGSIAIVTRDANGDNASASIDVGALTAVGGEGAKGAGGVGAFIDVRTQASQRVVQTNPPTDPLPDPPVVLQEVQGGGSVTVASADASGGKGGTTGGNAGAASPFSPLAIRVTAAGEGNELTIGTLSARGGDGQAGNGGAGRNVALTTEDGDLSVDAIDTSGGAGHNAAKPNTALGGSGGAVTLTAGSAEDASAGDITLRGQIDATEGTSEAAVTTAVDGGAVTLDASGSIERAGVTDPQIRTGGAVSLTAGTNIGNQAQLQIEGGGEDVDQLNVTAGGRADVHVKNVGFPTVFVTATNATADIDVTQFGDNGGNLIDMAGSGGQMVVNRVDTRDNQIDVSVGFDNLDDDTPDGALVLATSSANTGVRAGGVFQVLSDGDLVVGTTDGIVIHSVERDPGAQPTDPIDPGLVILFADNDEDGTGELRDAAGSATGVIDMRGDAATPGELNLTASDGIGEAGDPITVSGGARLSALNEPSPGDLVPDPDAVSGIFVRNVASAALPASGDLTIARATSFPNHTGAAVTSGSGEIEITNEVGDLIVAGAIDAKPADPVTSGAGGDVTLAVQDSSAEIVLNTGFAIESGGVQTYDGDVVLARATSVAADGGVDINGGLDTRDTAANPVGLTATLGVEATDVTPFAVSDGIGATRPLASFTVAAPDGGDVALDTPSIRTAGLQTYLTDLQLPQFVAFDAGTQILFAGTGDHQSVTGPAGFSLDTSGVPISPEATIAKPNGSLTLDSTGGSIRIGDGEKLSVAGSLTIAAPAGTARFTDLSALDISVTSPDAQVFARAPGPVATPSGATILDGGTDLVANTVTFSTAPTVVGGGPAPRIATPSGTAQNPGALSVRPLPVPISSADIASGSRVFDLAIPAVDPGHETQEIPTAPVEPPIEPQPSQDRAGPGAPVSREEVVAFLACAPLGDEYAPTGCAPTAQPAYGSALDTERAVEVARAYRALLSDSERATAGRAALKNAALDPRADIGSATSPAGRAYLTEVARVLGQVRLLGLGERYAEVRADLLAAVAAAIGSPQLDAARLGAAVDARAMGMPI